MEQKLVLISICGRAGSKGFKNKNLKIFDGHPLSYYSLLRRSCSSGAGRTLPSTCA